MAVYRIRHTPRGAVAAAGAVTVAVLNVGQASAFALHLQPTHKMNRQPSRGAVNLDAAEALSAHESNLDAESASI